MSSTAQILRNFIGTVDRAYNGIYEKFKQCAYTEGTVLHPVAPNHKGFIIERSDGQINSVEVNGAFRIQKLPYARKKAPGATKSSSTGLEVLLKSCDIYKFKDKKPSFDNSFLYKSTVRVGYYKISKKKWIPLLNIRYDYGNIPDAHPIFHAQLEDGDLANEFRNEYNLTDTIPEVERTHEVPEHIRFPTPNVVGATALLTLAADHLSLGNFPQMLATVRQHPIFNADWRCNDSDMDQGLPTTPAVTGWYSNKIY